MSIKHVKQEFQQICEDYSSFQEDLKYFAEELNNKIITEEEYNKYLESFNQAKQRWQDWSYIINLLYMPNKKEKQRRYKRTEFKSAHDQMVQDKEKFAGDIKEINGRIS